MAIFKNTQTNLSKVDRLLYLVNSTYYLGVGKNTSWNNSWGTNIDDNNPPTPQTSITELPEIALYKRPYFQTLATNSTCEDVEFASCGESLGNKKVTLINLEVSSRELLEVINPDYLYFRIMIENSDLELAGISSFRVAGLYKDISFNSANQIRYLPNTLTSQGKLYWVSYFTPILQQTIINKTSVFEILLTL